MQPQFFLSESVAMLLEFSCRNFRSFKGEARLTLLPVNAYKEHLENLAPVRPAGTGANGVLSAAAIYGSNASGKTNLLKAIAFAKSVVLGGSKSSVHQTFVGCEDKDIYFSFSLFEGGIRYQYDFSVGQKGVSYENLTVQPKQQRLVFERRLLPDGTYSIKQGSRYRGVSTKLKGYSDNGLVLGLLSKFGVDDCATVFNWFSDSLVVHDRGMAVLDYGMLLEKLMQLGESNFTNVISAVKSADLGITGAQLTVGDLTEQEKKDQRVVTDKIKAIFEALVGEGAGDFEPSDKKITFQFQHLIDGHQVGFGFDDESLGTVMMLNLAAVFVDAIASGKTIFIDEVERSLHPVLLKNLIALFFDRNLNKRNAQIVFTTHDLSIMGEDLLRRDQFWFVQKDPDEGCSELYPLSDFSPRKDESLLNRYLYGAYGAVPFIDGVM